MTSPKRDGEKETERTNGTRTQMKTGNVIKEKKDKTNKKTETQRKKEEKTN